jgi:hypothetical protein
MDDIVVKIPVELLSTLALATEELKQGRSSESVFVDLFLYSALRSQVCEACSRREGHRSDPTEARLTHSGRSSDDGRSDS